MHHALDVLLLAVVEVDMRLETRFEQEIFNGELFPMG